MLQFLKNVMPNDPKVDDRNSFLYTDEKNLHAKRGKAILKKHPEIKKLMKPFPLSALAVFIIVTLQIIISYGLKDQSLWLVLLLSFLMGSVISHALFVLLHDASHDLVFKSKILNKLIAIACNVGQGFPSAMSFQKFHLMHHGYLDNHEKDADPPLETEAKLIKGSPLRKIIWLFLLGLIQALRPSLKRIGKMWDKWFFLNLIFILSTDILIFQFFGWKSSLYIFASTIFGLGLHPVGARWIQEHYVFKKGQQTYSYYGLGNLLSFNIGYHNEHHDLSNVPWVSLPKLKKIAPEFYNNLFYHRSWTLLHWYFVFNTHYTLFSRYKVVNPDEKHSFLSKGEVISDLKL